MLNNWICRNSIFLTNFKLQPSTLDNNTLIKCVGDGWNNAVYSSRWIQHDNDTDIYSWDIKINKGNQNIYVGIVSNLHHQQNKDFDTKHSYSIDITNGRLNINGRFDGFPGHKCGEGDIFTFIVNLKQKQLECIKNHDISDKRILAKNLKIDDNVKYKLALNIYYNENTVTVKDNNADRDYIRNNLQIKEQMKCIKKAEDNILRMQEMIKKGYIWCN